MCGFVFFLNKTGPTFLAQGFYEIMYIENPGTWKDTVILREHKLYSVLWKCGAAL